MTEVLCGKIISRILIDAGTRVLPITEDVAQMFQAIIEDRNAPKVEKSIDRYKRNNERIHAYWI